MTPSGRENPTIEAVLRWSVGNRTGETRTGGGDEDGNEILQRILIPVREGQKSSLKFQPVTDAGDEQRKAACRK